MKVIVFYLINLLDEPRLNSKRNYRIFGKPNR